MQGSEGMYEWLAQDLAERGYVVLTYDVQGQGTSETFPHQGSPIDQDALPFCNPFATPGDGEMSGCPGVPSQQLSNFVVGTGTRSTSSPPPPARHYRNPRAAGADVTAFNPYWRLFDRSPDPHPATPGRTTRIAIIGHSMGAAAVSKVQGTDRRVAAVVALDKLTGPGSDGPLDGTGNVPVVPALAVQSEYGFTVSPWFLSGGSSLAPQPSPDGSGPAARARGPGTTRGARAGVDSMLVVPRASTHLEYTDIPLVLPGQPLRPGPHQRLRAALARPLPQAPRQHRIPARHPLPLPRARRRRPLGAGHPAPRTAAELLLLLGVRRADRRRTRAGTATSPASAADSPPPCTRRRHNGARDRGPRAPALRSRRADRPPPARWVAFLTLASIGLWAGFFGPIQVLLAQQAEAISVEHKKEILSLVLGLGAFTSVVCNPLFGAFSDRTTLRQGPAAARGSRVAPWAARSP